MAADVDFDTAVLRDWLAAETGVERDIAVCAMRGGGSCEMFELRRGDERWVIRRAPLARVADTAHDVVREYRIMEALQGGAVRVPGLLGVCENSDIIGAPFFIMQHIDGEVIRRRLPQPCLDRPDAQPALGEELIDALVELHAFEWRGTAIASLASPERFLERQVDRWMGQLERYGNRELTGVDATARWLADNRPATGDLTVMHGDYKIDNVLFSKTLPPRILALVDFEMTTVGDPLIDLAWAMIFWPEEGNVIAIAAPGGDGGMSADHCQSPDTLIQRYAERTGRDLDAFRWYQAFAAWKLGIVLEASYAKYLSGESKNPNHQFFGFVVDRLMERAQRFAV